MRALRRLVPPLAAALVLASVAACSSGGAATVEVSGPWARASSAMAAAGAAYLTIDNTGSAADALTRVASPAATTVEIHETVAMPGATPADGMGTGSPMPSASGDAGPMLGMQPVARLEIPAGGTVELKPGSYHIMLIGLTRELKAGDTIELTLTFEKAGDVKVSAEVRAG
jgi:copper(I)-binding protein